MALHRAQPMGKGSEHLLRAALAGNPFFAEPLFDALPEVVFFVKDDQGRYVRVNRTLVHRCGLRDKSSLIGRSAGDVFPPPFGATYLEQDRAVLATGAEICNQLELHLYPNRDPGWCLTHKIALRDAQQRIVGLAGISRDLGMPDNKHPVYRRIAAAARFIQDHYDQTIQMPDLTSMTNLSVSQIERYFQKIFDLTPRQMILKTRLNAAAAMLAGDASITEIAIACGYRDHSAFTRQFKATVGVAPSLYRTTLRNR